MRIISVLGLKSMPLVQFLAATAIVSWIESGTHRLYCGPDVICAPLS